MDPKSRFSSRVENYVKYRPGYPPGVVETLAPECALSPGSIVADIGSGTGLLSKLFLDAGCQVYGVEPNAEMRAAGERLLAAYPRFTSVDGAAEATTLPAAAVDFVTAGQAFHWFDPALARREFLRILRPGGWAALVWNGRREAGDFMKAYENLLYVYGTDYAQVNHHNVDENEQTLRDFFGGHFRVALFDNQQVFDYDGLQGRLLSSSYAPEPGQPNYEPMLTGLKQVFERYQVGGVVKFEYETKMIYGGIE